MTITVYSTPNCGFCKTLKEYLGERKVEFNAVDLAATPDKIPYVIQLTGQTGVPILVKEEEGREPQFVVGFKKEQVDALLGL